MSGPPRSKRAFGDITSGHQSDTAEPPLKVSRFNAKSDHASPSRHSDAKEPTTTSQQPIPTAAIKDALDFLTANDLRSVILDSTLQAPIVSQVLLARYDEKVRKEQAKVINFDHHSKDVWYAYNIKYARLSGSKQYDVAGQVLNEISGFHLHNQRKHARKQLPWHETQRSGDA